MSSLFSSFDPNLFSLPIPMNWVSAMLSLLCFPVSFWILKNQLSMAWKKLALYVEMEFYAIMGKSSVPGSTWPFVSLFVYIFLLNMVGLIPYVFPSTSHLVMSVSLAVPMWIGHMLFSWLKQPGFMLAHLVPLGTPVVLLPLMVIIELISSVIRPLTLSVRLAANIIAGHLLLTLLGSQASSMGLILVAVLMSALMTLSLLESAVALIQSYVFSTLSALYVSEAQTKHISKN